MRLKVLFLFIFLTSQIVFLAQSNLTFGGDENDIGYTLCNTNSGGYLLVGTTRSFGEGSEDIYLINLDKNYKLNFSKTLGFVHRDVIRSVISVSDGYILGGDQWDFGMARSDMSIQKIDLDGNIIWRNSFGTHYTERGFDVISTSEGGYYLLGYSRGYEPLGDIFLVKTDEQGNEIWRNNYGFDNDDYAFEMLEDDNGDLLIIGSRDSYFDDVHGNYKKHDANILLLKVDQSGELLWSESYGGDNHEFGYAIEKADDGGYYLAGSTQSYGNGKFDMLLLKIDEAGTLEWQKTYGGAGYEYCVTMDKNDDGDLFLIGTTKSYSNSADIFLNKLSANGDAIWSINLGGEGIDDGNDVLSSADGGCTLTGKIQDTATGKFDMVFFKITAEGLIENITAIPQFCNEDELVSFGPNPMSERGSFYNTENSTYTINLTNTQGQTVRSFEIGKGRTQFNRNSLPAGLYIYSILKEDKSVCTGKLIIH